METKEVKNDFRVYSYEGYSILRKPRLNKDHKFKSYEAALQRIDELRKINRLYKRYQLVVIDYSGFTSKIVHIDSRTDG